MGIFKKFIDKFRKKPEEIDYEEEWEESTQEERVDFTNREVREEYVRNCLGKIAEAAKELENLNFEYDTVTSYLKDMEEIEAIPEEEAEELKSCAKRVELLQNSRDDYMGRKRRMSDSRFQQIERMLDEIEEGCSKLREAEQYQELIKKDLSRLEGEKHAYFYRKNELIGTIADTKGMAVICVTALGLCFALLLGLQFLLEMDTEIGYLITAGVAALAITMIYVKHTEAKRELKRVELSINKIILLQNRARTGIQDLAPVHHDHMVTAGLDILHDMRRYDHGLPLPQLRQDPLKVHPLLRIEPRRRLIEHDQFRPAEQRLRHTDAAHHPA